MSFLPMRVSPIRLLAALVAVGLLTPEPRIGRAGGLPLVAAQQTGKKAEPDRSPWRATGRVTDQDGRPLVGVEVWAHCGMGTLFRTGVATSGEDGRYELSFGPGILSVRGGGATVQAATISAHKPGYSEENLNRQGGCRAADGVPDEAQIKAWGVRADRLFLPGRSMEINFSMRPAARVSGKLVDEQGRPLAGYSVALNGSDLPPSSSVVCSAYADEQGRFSLEDIPTNFLYQFEVRMADPKPPWDDSWASAALRFERPERGDLRAWFGNREIRLQEFVLRVVGPGVHGRNATPVAGNAGVLNLTSDDPVLEKSDTLLFAKSAVLTLRNSPAKDPDRSLVRESIPASSAIMSKTRLARSKPNESGECTISFENPSGFELEPGKHQVIFQVFVGTSQKPICEKIFRQLDVLREGRYEVPVKIAPEWIDDSRVSITFVTIQPDHDAWVRSFFLEGKGTSYKGLWTGDGGLMPAIPFAAAQPDK
jgi:hypothetical protein